MDRPFEPSKDIPLGPKTTLELGGPARYFVEIRDERLLVDAFDWAAQHKTAVAILGGGSNVIVPDKGFDGLIVAMAIEGIQVVSESSVQVQLDVGAGESWDRFVERAGTEGWSGVECLSGIPGLVGGTPIQNVGAYGQEVSQTIEQVRVFDPSTRAFRWLSNQECRFGYRDAAFKHEWRHLVVTAVRFGLKKTPAQHPTYAELANALGGKNDLPIIRETVLRLRRAKSMVIDSGDPNRRSAGSFFTNPVVSAEQASEIAQRGLLLGAGSIPQWRQADGTVKLPAAWLIEQAGFSKGQRWGSFGISARHALAIVHHGGGTASELVAIANEIMTIVQSVFGVRLEMEPRILGASG